MSMAHKTTRNRLFHFASAFIMLGFGFYIFAHLFYFLDIPFLIKFIISIACFALSQCMTSMRYIVAFTPHMSYIALRITGALSAFFMTLVSIIMLYDFFILLFFATRSLLGIETANYLAWLSNGPLTITILSIALFVSYTGCKHALRCPLTVERELLVKNLPQELQGLRIAHLSDLHMGSTFDGKWLSQLVKNTNELQADLILITGDLVDGSPSKIASDVEELKQLSAKYGVHISLGNHEFYCGPKPWIETWTSWGLSVLVNRNVRLEHNGYPFVLSGVADREGRKFKGMLRPDMSEALKDVTDSDFVIFMEHQPKNADKNAKRGVNVQLSGHTHGGQYFLLFPLVKFLNGGHRVGFYYLDDMTLHVSPGTGLWGYAPVRVGSRNELTLLTLANKD